MAALLFAVLVASAPALRGPFWGHDIEAHVVRVAQWARGWADGVLYPRFFPDVYWGFGGPTMLYNAPAPYAVGALAMALGLSATDACRALAVGAFALGAAGAFLLARATLSVEAAALVAIAYTLVPYRLVDAWVRGALSELIATAILPLLFLAARRAAARRPAWPGLAFAVAALLLCHPPSALFCLPAAAAYGLLMAPDRRAAAAGLGLGLGFGLAAAAGYWLPALADHGATHYAASLVAGSPYHFAGHFVQPGQFVSTRWGFGLSQAGGDDGMSFQVGLVHLAGLALGAWVAWRQRGGARREAAFWLASSLASLLLMVEASRPLWELAAPLQRVQFPWRLLTLVALAASLLLGVGLEALTGVSARLRRLGLVALALVSLVAYARYAVALPPPPGVDLDAQATPAALQRWIGADSIWMPRVLRGAPPPGPRVRLLEGQARARLVSDRTHQLVLRVEGATASVWWARIAAFPGWTLTVDGVAAPLAIDPATGGLVAAVPAGEHDVALQFRATPLRHGAEWLSLLAMLPIAAACARPRD